MVSTPQLKIFDENPENRTKKKTVPTNIDVQKKGFQIYPPPTTPPEPAPPDHIGTSSMMRQYKSNLVSASQSSLDDITCKPKQNI